MYQIDSDFKSMGILKGGSRSDSFRCYKHTHVHYKNELANGFVYIQIKLTIESIVNCSINNNFSYLVSISKCCNVNFVITVGKCAFSLKDFELNSPVI